jgi:hypothetical protein
MASRRFSDPCLCVVAAAALAGFAAPAAAIEDAGAADFTATGSVDFDDLAPGTVLEPGDPVAPGVTFGGVFPEEESALVVDLGGGERALEQRVRENGSSSVVTFRFATPVEAAAATVTVVAEGGGNPGVTAYDDALGSLGAWGVSIPEGTPLSMGFRNALPPEPGIAYLLLATSQGGAGAERFRVDDLVFAPAPDGGDAAAAAALGLAAWRRRRR